MKLFDIAKQVNLNHFINWTSQALGAIIWLCAKYSTSSHLGTVHPTLRQVLPRYKHLGMVHPALRQVQTFGYSSSSSAPATPRPIPSTRLQWLDPQNSFFHLKIICFSKTFFSFSWYCFIIMLRLIVPYQREYSMKVKQCKT